MHPSRSQDRRSESGQNLVEVALITPFLLLLALNAINFGYYFYVALNITAAPRHAVEYAIQGNSTPAALQYPVAGPASGLLSISSLAYADIQNSLPSFGSATVQVCSVTVGALVNPGKTTQAAQCCATTSSTGTCTVGGGTLSSAPSDPESPYFVLHRVDVTYTLTPLIPGRVFGITLLPSFNFHQQVSMRAM